MSTFTFYIGLHRGSDQEIFWSDFSKNFEDTFAFDNQTNWNINWTCGVLKIIGNLILLDFTSCSDHDIGYICQYPPFEASSTDAINRTDTPDQTTTTGTTGRLNDIATYFI